MGREAAHLSLSATLATPLPISTFSLTVSALDLDARGGREQPVPVLPAGVAVRVEVVLGGVGVCGVERVLAVGQAAVDRLAHVAAEAGGGRCRGREGGRGLSLGCLI